MQTYLFYDIETTGLNKAFDQVLHFAAIRTDLSLNELSRHEVKVKLNPDVIPSPYALLTHKMGIKEIVSGAPEFEAIKQIHQWMNEPGTISLGYNTLGFDDEFLRFSFYRNLLKPYTHQYANQCFRMDIYPMTVMFYLFKNNALLWPEVGGRPSLKLENINAKNNLIQGRSHHAMVDVEVTLELARRLMQEREMWEYLHGYFKKEIDLGRMQPLQKETALAVSGKIGSQNNYQSPVLFLGNHRHYTNQSLWLRLDTEELSETTLDTIAEKTWVINKKPGEPNFILPFKDRFLTHIDAGRLALTEKNKQWLQENPTLFEKIVDYYSHYKYPVYPQTDVEASLYINGFWSSIDETFCQRFHAAIVSDKVKAAENVKNPTLQGLALRILGRNYPEALGLSETEKFSTYLQSINSSNVDEVPIDFQGRKRMSPRVAMEEIKTLRAETELNSEDLVLLEDFEA
ncbi:MAG: exonuclease domain-containing protein, partial [Gammaproteobacteria bacterium]